MNRLRCFILVGFALLAAAMTPALAADKPPAPQTNQAPQANQANQVNFGKADNVLDLKPALSPYRAPGGTAEADGSSWYIVQVSNDSVRPATRVLLAGQPPRAALSLLPRRSRPAILAVASSDSGTVVETASAYGRRAWRVIV
ncbi:MAG TPA: hypothetical protein VNN98_00205, partial [Rhizomicrobium sp.]|nr:hypothetical protein [Rhizomicrobium sp.]